MHIRIPRALLALVISLLSAVAAQASTTTWQSISKAPVRTATLTAGQPISIYLVNLGQDNALSIEAVSGTTLTAQAWEIDYSGPSRSPSNLRLSTISKLANSAATWANNTLTITGSVVADKRIGIRLQIPTGTQVTLYGNGKLLKNGTVTSSLLVRSGFVVSGATTFDARAVLVTAVQDNYSVCSSYASEDCFQQDCTFTDGSGNSCGTAFTVCFVGDDLEATLETNCE